MMPTDCKILVWKPGATIWKLVKEEQKRNVFLGTTYLFPESGGGGGGGAQTSSSASPVR